MGGIDRTAQKEAEGRLYALYIDPAAKAGILKGSFSGAILPEISMWEADGAINRFQLINNTGITPSALPVGWYSADYNYLSLVNVPSCMITPTPTVSFLTRTKILLAQ